MTDGGREGIKPLSGVTSNSARLETRQPSQGIPNPLLCPSDRLGGDPVGPY